MCLFVEITIVNNQQTSLKIFIFARINTNSPLFQMTIIIIYIIAAERVSNDRFHRKRKKNTNNTIENVNRKQEKNSDVFSFHFPIMEKISWTADAREKKKSSKTKRSEKNPTRPSDVKLKAFRRVCATEKKIMKYEGHFDIGSDIQYLPISPQLCSNLSESYLCAFRLRGSVIVFFVSAKITIHVSMPSFTHYEQLTFIKSRNDDVFRSQANSRIHGH